MLTGTKIPSQSQAWWQKEKIGNAKHIQDATSLALMSKGDIYEKLFNSRSKGKMRNWLTIALKDQREKVAEAINTEGVISKEEDQTHRERIQ